MFSMAKNIVTIKTRNEHIASRKFCLSSAWSMVSFKADEEIARNLKLKITFLMLILNGPSKLVLHKMVVNILKNSYKKENTSNLSMIYIVLRFSPLDNLLAFSYRIFLIL
uniref:Uncharacterized protein n=1 Tax=Mus musculus TaxID=10090 RepID=Q8C4G0_MOUSE|nr:unnamed protein product [Mus musculus]